MSEPEDQVEDYVLTKEKSKVTKIEKIENKPKKNKSEAQIEQFRQMSIKRQAQMAQAKKEKALLEAKILLKEEEE